MVRPRAVKQLSDEERIQSDALSVSCCHVGILVTWADPLTWADPVRCSLSSLLSRRLVMPLVTWADPVTWVDPVTWADPVRCSLSLALCHVGLSRLCRFGGSCLVGESCQMLSLSRFLSCGLNDVSFLSCGLKDVSDPFHPFAVRNRNGHALRDFLFLFHACSQVFVTHTALFQWSTATRGV